MKHGLLILLVCAGRLSFAQSSPDLQNQARTAVAEKRFSDALPLYRSLLSMHPRDVDDILWIARLSAWTGDRAGAVDFYSQALALDPKNVDAMVGKANVLLWQHSFRDAFVLLTEAHELGPSNPDVELAWSRYYHWQGEEREAKLHLETCLAFDGNNQEALKLKESLIPGHTIEGRIAYEMDTLPGTSPGSMEQIGADYFYLHGDIGVDYFHLNRFGEAGSRGGLHFSRKLGGLTSVRGAALFGEGGDIAARRDLSAGVSHTVLKGLVLGADYRYIAFRTVKVNAAIADFDYYFEKPFWITTNVAANRVAGATTPAFSARLNTRVRKNLTVNVAYAHGTEIFQLALPTDFAAFRRDSYIGGVTSGITKKTRVEGTYKLARRSTGIFENMFLLALVHTL
jgi:YaiO family outer membrane protein